MLEKFSAIAFALAISIVSSSICQAELPLEDAMAAVNQVDKLIACDAASADLIVCISKSDTEYYFVRMSTNLSVERQTPDCTFGDCAPSAPAAPPVAPAQPARRFFFIFFS